MRTLKALTHQQLFASQLQGLVEISQEVSVLSMQQVRQSILDSRSYMEGLIDLFKDVRASHEKEIAKLLEKKKSASLISKLTTKKEVCLLLTPSGKFSGSLVKETFAEFSEYIKKSNAEIAVVGSTGQELTKRFLPQKVATKYFAVNLDHPTQAQVSDLLSHIIQYQNITVFTGKFQSLAIQRPSTYNITGNDSLRSQTADEKPPTTFLFEPALSQIVAFFNAQVTASLFKQTLGESKLANLGSRIMTLEASRSGIGLELKSLAKKVRQAQRHQQNKKQFNRLSGQRLWT